ncbi:hypothetical protein EPD60_02295 [Flaviaesturariibacter flavus]|uniref:Uncharacterized protein n=1 Tax=Flaviaesturariibacter flavus TaxID=2502780 RepID=A0A4R1BNY0_9BACT|nr:hypothetical protein [Flaviaesturariibacter flavus]TCJ19269.1 hypothetical protein EPD60_02295 [Flaviaesturariibacter flavus]
MEEQRNRVGIFFTHFLRHFVAILLLLVAMRYVTGGWQEEQDHSRALLRYTVIATFMGLVQTFTRKKEKSNGAVSEGEADELAGRTLKWYWRHALFFYLFCLALGAVLLIVGLVIIHFILGKGFPFFLMLERLALVLLPAGILYSVSKFVADRNRLRRFRKEHF